MTPTPSVRPLAIPRRPVSGRLPLLLALVALLGAGHLGWVPSRTEDPDDGAALAVGAGHAWLMVTRQGGTLVIRDDQGVLVCERPVAGITHMALDATLGVTIAGDLAV